MVSGPYQYDAGTLSCIVYGQDGEIYDRGWPELETEMGVGEYVYGSSLVIMQSENGTPNSTFIFSPQLIDTCRDGSTLNGGGFTTTIATNCTSASSSSLNDLVYAGVDSSVVSSFKLKLDEMIQGAGMAVSLVQVGNHSILITHSLVGTGVMR